MKRRPARPLKSAKATGNGVKEKPVSNALRETLPVLRFPMLKKEANTMRRLSGAEDVYDCEHHLLPFLKSCFAARIISRDTDTCANFEALFLASGA